MHLLGEDAHRFAAAEAEEPTDVDDDPLGGI
jgi:hypothetical protein